MGYLDDFLSGTKDIGYKAAEVGLGALEQLNRPAAAVTETIAEAGKGIGRTAGALTSWLTEGERPELGEAFTPAEKIQEELKRGETMGVTEALTGLAKTAVAPVAGFIKNKPVAEIIGEKQGAPTPDTVTEATKANISAIQEAKKSPAALAQIKKEGGLPVNAQETWSELLKEPETRELVSIPAITLDPLLYGAGIGAKTAKGVEAAKTTEGMAPTLLGQLAEGERTAVGFGKVGKEFAIPFTGKSFPVADTINSAINKLQQASDYVTEAVAGKAKTGIENLAKEYEWVDKSLEVADSARKALFNRSKDKDYNQIQELLVNNGKTRANTAEEFLKEVEKQTAFVEPAHPEYFVNYASDETVKKIMTGDSPWLDDSLLHALGDKMLKKIPSAPLLPIMDKASTTHSPSVVDLLERPEAALRDIKKHVSEVKRSFDENYIFAGRETFSNIMSDPTFRKNYISDEVLSAMKANGYIPPSTTLRQLYEFGGDLIYTKNTADNFLNFMKESVNSNKAFQKNEAVDYIYNNYFKGHKGASFFDIPDNVISEAKDLSGWGKISKFFNSNSMADVTPKKFLGNLLNPEAKEAARKLKLNVVNIATDFVKNFPDETKDIASLNKAIESVYPQLKNSFSQDPVKILTSYGLGLGDNKWKDNIYKWVIDKASQGSDVVIDITHGDAPAGYVSLWREKLPNYAIKEDLYKPLSDSLGKIIGTPEPATIIENAYNRYRQLWKKSVLTGLFGEGYGYAVRNITSEALKTAQSGYNTLGELMKVAVPGHIDSLANKLADSKLATKIPMLKELPKLTSYIKPTKGAAASILDNKPWNIITKDGQTINAFEEAKRLGVIDSGFFAEEVFKGGELSDKIKIKLLPATKINEARVQYANLIKALDSGAINPMDKTAGRSFAELSDMDRDELLQLFADKYGIDPNVLKQTKDLPESLIPVSNGKGFIGWLESSDTFGAGILANNAEKTARLTTFGKAIEDGYTPEAAARLVGETSFNYTDISNEAKTMKAMIPFLTFYLKNIPFQLGKFISEPKVQRYLQHGLELSLPSKEELDKMPDYEKERLPLNTKVPYIGGTGMRQYLAQFQSLGLAQEIKEGKLGKATEEGLKDIISAVDPLMRLAIELGTGTTVPGSRTTPLGATGGNILGMDRPIERYTGEKGALFLPNPVTGLTVPVPKKVEYVVETLVPPASKLGKLAELGETKGREGVGKQLLRYTTGVGASEPKTAKEIRLAERSDKIAIQQDIRKSRLLLRRYKKDLKDGKISQSQFDQHKESLKNLEVELKKAYRTKKPVTIQEGSPVSDMLKEVNKIELPEEQTETSVSPLMNFFETPVEEQAIKPSIIKEFTAPEIEKVKSPIDEFINSGYNNTGDDNMSKEVADKAINFALRNEDDSYDKNAKLENLGDGAGLTFIGLTEKYDEGHLKNKYGLSIKQLADLYKTDKAKALEIVKDTYQDLYWNKAFDNLKDERLAIRLFDLMLNRGAGGLRSILSNAGYKLENLNDYIDKQGKDTVYKNIVDSAEELYRGLKNFNRFGTGWLNRLKRSEYTV